MQSQKQLIRLFVLNITETVTLLLQQNENLSCSVQIDGYPVYLHELDNLFLYYKFLEYNLVIGPHQSQGLLRVRKIPSSGHPPSDVDYSESRYFDFTSWKEWDPRRHQFVENRKLSRVRLQCVDENFGYCSSGRLYPSHLYTRYGVPVAGPGFSLPETIRFTQMHFRLLDNVYYNLRPVYEMVIENVTRTSQQHAVRWYMFHMNGKWQVGTVIGSLPSTTGFQLELEGNAMRLEYENDTVWNWRPTAMNRPEKAFGHLQCRRQLPSGIDCQTAGNVTCENGGTCQTDADGTLSCLCPVGYRGIQCEHRESVCAVPFQAPPYASVFASRPPHRDGSIVTVFCLSQRGDVHYVQCQNGSWQLPSLIECPSTETTTVLATTTRLPLFNQSDAVYISRDSVGTIATVVVALICVQLGFPFLCYCCVACCRSDDEHLDKEVPVDDDLKQETRKQKTSLQRTCSGFFYLCWWAWLVLVIIYFAQYGHVPLDGSSVLSAVVIMAMVCLGVLYCCVFSESFCSHEYDYLTQLENEEVTTGEQIAEMKAARPMITFQAECSHNETKTRTVQQLSYVAISYLLDIG